MNAGSSAALLLGAMTLLLAACGGGGAKQAAPSTPQSASQTQAQPKQLGSFKIGSSTPAGDVNLPIWLGIDQGFYQKRGVKIEFVGTGTGNTTIAALLGGDVAAAGSGTSDIAEANLSGADVRAVMSIQHRIPYVLATDSSINRPEDLKGKFIADANPGGLGDIVTRLVLSQYNLDPDKDVKLLYLGTPSTRVQAVKSGQAQATLASATDPIQGLKILLDLRDSTIPYQGTVIGMTEKFVKSNPDAGQAIVAGTWDGLKFLSDPKNKEQVLASLKNNLKLTDDQAAEMYPNTLKEFQATLPPTVDVDGVAKLDSLYAARDPRMSGVDPKSVIDGSLIDKLQAEGYK